MGLCQGAPSPPGSSLIGTAVVVAQLPCTISLEHLLQGERALPGNGGHCVRRFLQSFICFKVLLSDVIDYG